MPITIPAPAAVDQIVSMLPPAIWIVLLLRCHCWLRRGSPALGGIGVGVGVGVGVGAGVGVLPPPTQGAASGWPGGTQPPFTQIHPGPGAVPVPPLHATAGAG